jgi:hypothetical protein
VTRRGLEAAAATAAYTALALATTWPLARDPSRATVVHPDVYGSTWLFAWAVHQAIADPTRLLDPNVFHPAPQPLGLTETFVPQALQAAPVLLAGGAPLLAFNVVFLLTFVLSGLGAYLLARDVGCGRAAAGVAGLVYGFSPLRLSEIFHVQALSAQWLPFVALFLRRALRGEGGRGALVGLFAFSVLQGLSSGYHAVSLAVTVLAVGGWELRSATPQARWRTLGALAAAAVVVGAGLLPYPLARRAEERARGITLARPPEELDYGSARVESLIAPGPFPVWPHQRALARRFETTPLFPSIVPLFPGVAVFVLAVIGAWRSPPREAMAFVILAAAGFLLALGPWIRLGSVSIPGPFWLFHWTGMLRFPSRIGMVFVLGMAVLAALGLAHVARSRPRWGIAAALVAALEGVPGNIGYWVRGVEMPPPTVRWLREAPAGVVLELPWDHETEARGCVYTYWSTGHWRKMVNGWGGYRCERSFALGHIARHFPEGWPSRELRRAGVRYVVVHMKDVTERQRRYLELPDPLPAGIALVTDFGPQRIYEIDPAGPLEKTPVSR